ncbi:MAG: DUF1273 domain-containing protein [Bacillus sp. (in: firmicutes)]
MKVLYVTGYKSFEMGIFKNDAPEVTIIKLAIERTIRQLLDEGLEWVLISGQLGVELWAGEVVLALQEEYQELKLGVLTAFLDQESGWSEMNQEYYHSIIGCADLVETISKQPYVSPAQFRNRDQFILHKSDAALVIYDEQQEGSVKYFYQEAKKYEEKNPFRIIQVDFYDLQAIMEDITFLHAHNNDDF